MTDIAKFGQGTLDVQGGQRVEVAPSLDFDYTTGDFTVDCWVSNDNPIMYYPFAWFLDSDNYLTVSRFSSNGNKVKLRLAYRVGGSTIFAIDTIVDQALGDGGYHHIAVVHATATISLWLDGLVRAVHNYTDGQQPIDLSSWMLYVGCAVNFSTNELDRHDGAIDEFRVSNAERYTGNFTPKNEAYTRTILSGSRTAYRLKRSVVCSFRSAYGAGLRSITSQEVGTYKAVAQYIVPSKTAYKQKVNYAQTDKTSYAAGTRSVVSCSRTAFRLFNTFVVSERSAYTQHSIVVTLAEKSAYRAVGLYINNEKTAYMQQRTFIVGHRTAYRAENTTLERFELYENLGSMPDFTNPVATSATLPFNSPAISGEGEHFFVLRKRNKYNQLSENIDVFKVELDGVDDEIVVAPTGPIALTWQLGPNIAGEEVTVTAKYLAGQDFDNAADEFIVYASTSTVIDAATWPEDGSNPSQTVIPMIIADGVANLDIGVIVLSLSSFMVGVRTRRASDTRLSNTIEKVEITIGGTASDPPPSIVAPEFAV